MALLTTGGLAELLDPSLRKVYLETGKDRPPEHPFIFNVANMDWNPMQDQQITGLGTMPTKPEGTQFVLDQPLVGTKKEYEAVAYGMGLEMTFESAPRFPAANPGVAIHRRVGSNRRPAPYPVKHPPLFGCASGRAQRDPMESRNSMPRAATPRR